MKRQQIMALAMTALAAGVFAWSGRSYAYALSIVAVAAIGAPGKFTLHLSAARRSILVLALGLVFAAVWRYAPHDDPAVQGFLGYDMAHAFAMYFLSLMALHFYLPENLSLRLELPLLAVTVLICSGDVLADMAADRSYQMFALAMAVAVALYCASLRKRPAERTGRRPLLRGVLAGTVLVLTVAVSAWSSRMLLRHQSTIASTLNRGVQMPPGPMIRFDRTAELTSITQMRQKDQNRIILRAFCDEPPGYLRARAFDAYGNGQWAASGGSSEIDPTHQEALAFTAGTGNAFLLPHGPSVRPEKVVEVWPSPDILDGMFTPLGTVQMRAAADKIRVDPHGVVDAADIDAGQNYAAGAAPAGATVPPPYLDDVRRRLTAADTLGPEVRTLADDIFAGCRTSREKMLAVENYFRERYEYRIGITIPPGEDPLVYFLTAEPKPAAHCEYFASGAAVLLRLGGVPTRYVTGVVAAERNDAGGYWVARRRDAHAWVEAWDEEAGRWVLVEATPPGGVPAPTEPSALSQWWDVLKLRWQEFRALLDREGPLALLKWIGRGLLALGVWLATTPPGWAASAAIVLLAAWRLRKRLHKRRRQHPEPGLAELRRLLTLMDRRMKRLGFVRRPSETLHQFASRVERAQGPAVEPLQAETPEAARKAARWYVAYAAVRYGRADRTEAAAALRAALPKRGPQRAASDRQARMP